MEFNDSFSELHSEAPANDEEHLVFLLMLMPYERAGELYQLDVLTVQLGHDSRLPVIAEQRQFLGEVYLLHAPGTEFHIGRIDMVANTGTYVDAPFHRYPDGKDLADLRLLLRHIPAVK